jgi:hypothetical protein
VTTAATRSGREQSRPATPALRHNWCMAEILWPRRETRRQTENTNFTPTALEDLSLLDKNLCGPMKIFSQGPTEP